MVLLVIIAVLAVVYGVGPRMPRAGLMDSALPSISVGVDGIERYVREKEAGCPVKTDNESRILWGDSVQRRTEYVLLYLHGFSASCQEGFPVTRDFVRKFRVNAYLPRLAGHGLNVSEPLIDMTPENLYRSAKEALTVARKLGRKVIIMGTSTGCTLALMLAADYPRLVDALILYSPNIRIKNPLAPLLTGPWGLQIARLVQGGKYAVSGDAADSENCKYWYCRYRVEAQVYLQQLLEMRMNAGEFRKVCQPVFLGYYYRDACHQDRTVDIKAALRMFDELGTLAEEKVKAAFPEAGTHVIACGLSSKAVAEVRSATFEFARKILKIEK